MDSVTVSSIYGGKLVLPLIKPYKLSFITLESFTVYWVVLKNNRGQYGIGESVLLPGYGSENEDKSDYFWNSILPNCKNQTQSEIIAQLSSYRNSYPFSTSAVASGLDFLKINADKRKFSIPVVYPIGYSDRSEKIHNQLASGLRDGYSHFKVKLGRNENYNNITTKTICDFSNDHRLYSFRFDANQALSFDHAVHLAKLIETYQNKNILWLEQPLKMNAWQDMARLVSKTGIPLILDEPIYTAEDILRAKKIGCSGVKLKLCKHLGIQHTLQLADIAHQENLRLTIGNGVATDISNFAECIIVNSIKKDREIAVESNGFAKLQHPVLFESLRITNGCAEWKQTTPLDWKKKLRALKKNSISFFNYE